MPPQGSTVTPATSVPISTAVSTPMPANPALAPTTDYGTAYGELGAQYQPQVDEETAALGTLAQSQQTAQASLDQAKVNAFKTNGLTANSRGLLFSGYTPSANDSYVTNTYNPNVQKLNTSTANSAQSLQDKISEINNERANAAQTLVSDTTTANNEAATKAAAAAKSAASAAQPTTNEIADVIRGNLSKVTGSDGYISPEDYAKAYIDWLNNGQSASSFASTFSSFVNPANKYYDYAVTQAVKRAS